MGCGSSRGGSIDGVKAELSLRRRPSSPELTDNKIEFTEESIKREEKSLQLFEEEEESCTKKVGKFFITNLCA